MIESGYSLRWTKRMNRSPGDEPKGIGGWLLLLAFSLVALPGRVAMNQKDAREAFSSPELAALIRSDSPTYDVNWFVLYSCALPALYVVGFLGLILLPYFFTKSRLFPLAFSLFAAFVVALNTVELIASFKAPGVDASYRESIIIQGTVGSSVLILWTLYLFRSRRARNTFTN